MSKSKKVSITTQAFCLVRKDGGYSIVELTIKDGEVVQTSSSVVDVLAIAQAKLSKQMKPE